MGGVGSAIGGARGTEDILFGRATGAMVGALNFAEEASREKNEAKNNEQQIEAKLKSLKKGGTISGKELAELLGKPEVSLAISKITRVDETTFKVERTFGGKLFLKDSPMTIEKTKLTLDNKPESVYRIKIDYKKFGINQGCLPDFYIYNNRVIYFDKTTNNWFYGATK